MIGDVFRVLKTRHPYDALKFDRIKHLERKEPRYVEKNDRSEDIDILH